jgi:hypothetical protein
MLQEAVQTFDLEGWLAGHGAVGGGSEWVLPCPGCGKNNLCVNTRRRLWHCWSCEQYVVDVEGKRRPVRGAGGLVKLVQLLDRVDRAQAIAKIEAGSIYSYRDMVRLPEDDLHQQYMGAIRVADPVDPPEGWQPITEVLPFMAQRQITLEDARLFGLGWCDRGRYRGRLIFPVWEDRRLLYFQGRAMWAPTPGQRYLKSLNPPTGDRHAVSSELLMNLDQAKFYPRVAIVEGPTDLVRTGPDAVATFGKRLTDAQIGRLIRAGVRAVDLMWDADAVPEMRAAARRLTGLFDLRVVVLPSGDPGDFPRDYLTRARMRANNFEMSGLRTI